jgi:HSP20 family molecular chaperone IbpA
MSVSPSGGLPLGATTTSSTKMSMTTSTSTSKTTTTKVTKKTSTSSSYSMSSQTTITSSGGSTTSYKTIKTQSSSGSFSDGLASIMGISADQEMEKLKSLMSQEMSRMHSEMFSLKAIEGSTSSAPESTVVHFDPKSIMDYVDHDKLRLNFDVSNFASETVNVKAVGNKIEVHAQRKTKTNDGETSEEFSRTYEMPTKEEIHQDKVTSSLYKDGVLTIQLPVSEAMQGVEAK